MPATALDPKTALVVIDLQKGIAAMLPPGTAFPDVVARTAKLAAAFRAAKQPVIWVTVGMSADGGEYLRPRAEVSRPVPSSPGFAELLPELNVQPADLHVLKRQPNAFYGTELELQLRRRGVTGIVLTGVSTSQGVDATARAAHERSFNVTFATDCMMDLDAAAHDFEMKKIFPRLGELDTSEMIVRFLSGN